MSRGPEEITLFSFDYPPLSGGISRLCSALASALSDSSGRPARVITRSASRITSVRPLRELHALCSLLSLRAGSSRAPLICGLWYPEGLLAFLAGARPRVILAHGAELMPARSRLRRGIWRWLMRRVLTSADLVVANSDYTAGLVSRHCPGSRVVALPLAVDAEKFQPGDRVGARERLGVGSDTRGRTVICSVSRIHRFKGYETVFEALAVLNEEERSRILYLVAGTGPDLVFLKTRAKELGVESLVRWLGHVPEANLPDVYRASELFVLCTEEREGSREVEGFGLVFLEAQACAIPVVGAASGGIPDAVEHGNGGWLIQQRDSAALSRILSRLLADPREFSRQGELARKRILDGFTWSGYVGRLNNILRETGVWKTGSR